MGNLSISAAEPEVEFVAGEELGRGAYGRVFKTKYRGSVYAAKEVHSIMIQLTQKAPEERRRLQESFQRECDYCSNLDHPNIVRFIGIYHPPQQPFPVMIMELMDESLTTYAEKPNIRFKRRISILYDVAEGLSYLHSRNPPVIHRDLSPNNVLLKHLPLLSVAKIADLGVAKILNFDSKVSKSYQTKVPGTSDFMPPEALEDKPQYDTSLDVFSYGGIMLHTINGKWPTPTSLAKFDSMTRQVRGFSEVERRQEHLDMMEGEAKVLRPLVEACLDNDPAKRPSILDMLKKIPLKESPPLVPALQSNCYELTWEDCAELPSPFFGASVVLHDNKVYAMAGDAPDDDTYDYVYVYDINGNQWDRLPPPGQYKGRLVVINSKLTVIGGRDMTTGKRTNKVTTYINNSWNNIYPNMIKARNKPGTMTHLNYVIVAGGSTADRTFSDDIELLNYKQSSHWVMARMKLPEPMWIPSLTISDNLLYIVGYSGASGRTSAAYKLSIDMITSPAEQLTSNYNHWTELPPAPHTHTAIILNSSLPVIIGGHDEQYVPTADIRVLDVPNNSWKKIASLTSPRVDTAVVPINLDSILVIGGYTAERSRDVEEAKKHSITRVEKGSIRLCHEN